MRTRTKLLAAGSTTKGLTVLENSIVRSFSVAPPAIRSAFSVDSIFSLKIKRPAASACAWLEVLQWRQ
jgi:hypothetical protein